MPRPCGFCLSQEVTWNGKNNLVVMNEGVCFLSNEYVG